MQKHLNKRNSAKYTSVYRAAAAAFIAFMLTSCQNSDSRILEQLGFTTATSYDLVQKGEGDQKVDYLRVGISIPKADPDAISRREVLVTEGKTSKEARIRLSEQTNRTLVSGQLRNAMFDIGLARTGLWKHIDTIIRDPSIGPHVKVIVTNGSAYDILAKEYPQHPTIGVYLSEMLAKEAKSNAVPEVNIYQFSRDYHDDGIDPVAPIVKLGENHIQIDGIALFRSDQYITKIEPADGIVFSFLRDNIRQGELSVDMEETEPNNEFAMLSYITSSRKIQVTPPAGQDPLPEINIALKLKCSVLEYVGDQDSSTVAGQKGLEDKIEAKIQKKALELIQMMQQHNVDSLGLGQHVRNRIGYDQWQKLDWPAVYPKVKVNIKVKIRIKDFGKIK
ncbi:Ger(x)C family spore germination protein [Paenibacillaceae bacterium]|nr:Ger(x)C family spore germination protein [Paenibacillaceae bacterium]